MFITLLPGAPHIHIDQMNGVTESYVRDSAGLYTPRPFTKRRVKRRTMFITLKDYPTYARPYARTHACTHAPTHARTHTHTHTYTHIHTHTHTHTLLLSTSRNTDPHQHLPGRDSLMVNTHNITAGNKVAFSAW